MWVTPSSVQHLQDEQNLEGNLTNGVAPESHSCRMKMLKNLSGGQQGI